MKEAKYYAAGQPRTPSGSAGAAVDDALGYLVQNTFPKLGFLKHPASNPQAEIRSILSAPSDNGLGLEGGVANAEALKEVLNYVSLMASKSHGCALRPC